MKKFLIVIMALVMLLPSLFTPKINLAYAESTPIAAVVTENMKRQYILNSADQSTLIRNFLNNNTVDRARFSFFNGEELLYYFEFLATQTIVNGVEYDVLKYDGSLFGNYWFVLNTYQETGLVYAYSKNGDNFSNQNLTRVDLLLNNEFLISNLVFVVQTVGRIVNNSTFDYIIPSIIDQSLLTLQNEGLITSAYYPFNYTVTLPTSLTKTGHTFTGWLNSDTNEAVTTPFVMPATDVNLVASFSVNSYQINFITNGASSIAPLSVDYGANITVPTPIRTGYTFGGWYSNSSLTTAFITTTMPAEDLTIYAKWTVNEIEEPTDPEEPGGPTDPTDPEEPGTPTNPEEPGNNNNNNTGGGFWNDVGNFFKKIGNGIGKGAKSFADFWKTDAGKWTAIAIGSVIVIAGIVGIAIWAIPAVGAAGGFFPALKLIAANTLIPLLKIMFTSKVALFIWTPVLAVAGAYLGFKLLWPEGAEALEKGYEAVKEGVEWIDNNIVDPFANATGLPKILVWPMVIALIPLAIILVYDAVKAFIRGLLSLLFNKKEKQKQAITKPKKKTKKGRKK